MKTNWIVDQYILESRSVSGDLLQAIRDSGSRLHQTKYIPFEPNQDYGPVDWNDQPTILYGTHGFISKCNRPFVPGAFGVSEVMNCNYYYTQYPRDWMLNEQFIMLPWGTVVDNPSEIDAHFKSCPDDIFIRPNSGSKTFAGSVFKYNESLSDELKLFERSAMVDRSTICLVAPVQQLQGEFRFIIVDGQVVDGSEYRWDNILDIRHDYPDVCLKAAEQVAQYHWQPDVAYTCDVALVSDQPKIIEINSFSCAGLYACDKRKVVDAINAVATKVYNDYNNI